jgi:uncharacterized membrane protein YukC
MHNSLFFFPNIRGRMKNNASAKKPSEEKEKVDESALVEAKIDDAVDEVADQTEGAAGGEASTSITEEKPNAEVGDGNQKKREKGGKNTTSDEVRNRC